MWANFFAKNILFSCSVIIYLLVQILRCKSKRKSKGGIYLFKKINQNTFKTDQYIDNNIDTSILENFKQSYALILLKYILFLIKTESSELNRIVYLSYSDIDFWKLVSTKLTPTLLAHVGASFISILLVFFREDS